MSSLDSVEETESVDSFFTGNESSEIEMNSESPMSNKDVSITHSRSSNLFSSALSGLLVFSFLIVILLLFLVIILLCRINNIPNENIDTLETHRTKSHESITHEYPFYLPSNDNYESYVDASDLNFDQANIFSDDESNVMYIFGRKKIDDDDDDYEYEDEEEDDEQNEILPGAIEDEVLTVFNIELDVYCCPYGVRKASMEQCDFITETDLIFPAKSIEHARQGVLAAFLGRIQGAQLTVKGRNRKLTDICPPGELPLPDVKNVVESPSETVFLCKGLCLPANFDRFLKRNGIEKDDPTENFLILKERVGKAGIDTCRMHNPEQIVEGVKTVRKAQEKYLNVLDDYCDNIEVKVTMSFLRDEKRKYRHVCAVGVLRCVYWVKGKSFSED